MIEVRLKAGEAGKGQAELVRLMLVRAGIPPEKISEKEQKGKVWLSVFTGSKKEARSIALAARSLRLRGVTIALIPLRDRDWKTRWKKYFKPFTIVPGIRIIPVWERADSSPGERGIRIDTTAAFGTGLHATTRMVAALIRSRRDGLGDFLDIGTGSGILSLIACAYGARRIEAIDVDREAVETARKNFRRNGCPDSHLAARDFEKFFPRRRYDFVAANLFTEDLVRFKGKLVSLVKPGCWLAVSGIAQENYPSFRRRFVDRRLRFEKAARRGKWRAVLFQRKES